MAVYKVPQDVEAEDKLLGPFSFKQFIFLLITVGSIGVAYGLSRISLPLVIIPLPVILFFGALALPLRKDQPMEVYLAAIISFIMKPKVRLWRPDGIETLIEVVAMMSDDREYGKGYSQQEVQKRLSYLSNIVDSQGWSIRGIPQESNSMRDELYNEALSVIDPLDNASARTQNIDSLLTQTDDRRRQELLERMQQPAPQPVIDATPSSEQIVARPEPIIYTHTFPQASTLYTPMAAIQPTTPDEDIQLVINPYPNMSQSILQPLAQTPPQPTPAQQPEPEPTPSPKPVSPAIIDLARNHADLSIETLQREASRIRQAEESEEVIISLR